MTVHAGTWALADLHALCRHLASSCDTSSHLTLSWLAGFLPFRSRYSPHGLALPSVHVLARVQGTVEGKIRDAQRDLFQKTLCQAYATLDRWVEKSMADVRAMETEVSR